MARQIMSPVPQRAPVRPRVNVPGSGEALPLEDEIQALIVAGVHTVVNLTGSVGCELPFALQHLAAVLPSDAVRVTAEAETRACIVVGASSSPPTEPAVVSYRLAGWGHDDLIEYLLTVHRDRCASVMARVRKSDHEFVRGIPELWRTVLDQLAKDSDVPDVRGALSRFLQDRLSDTDLVERARSVCLISLTRPCPEQSSAEEAFGAAGFGGDVVRVLRHAPVQLVLATERIVADLRASADCDFLALRLPRGLVQTVATEIASDDRALRHLRELIAGPPWSHAMTVSILHAANRDWVPVPGQLVALTGAYLDHAD